MGRPTMFMNWKMQQVKMLNLPKLIYRCDAILTSIQAGPFVNIDMFLKFTCKGKETRIARPFQKKNKVEGCILSYSKTCYKGTVFKTLWYWWKARDMDQWERLHSLEIEPQNKVNLFFAKKQNQFNKDKTLQKL